MATADSNSDDNNTTGTKRIKKLKRQIMRKNLMRSRRVSNETSNNSTKSIKSKSSKVVKCAGTTTQPHSVSTRSKISANDTNLNVNEEKLFNTRSKKLNEITGSCTFDSLNFTASTSVGHSDTMATEMTTLGLKPNERVGDMSWEKAVEKARGQPDGAERSFLSKKFKVDPKGNESKLGVSKLAKKPNFTKQITKVAKNKFGKLNPMKAKQKLDSSTSSMKRKLDTTETGPPTPKKKTKFSKLDSKDRKNVRKVLSKNEEKIKATKKLWNELQRHDLSKERRDEICKEFMGLVRGHAAQYVFCHDTGRTIQCLLKYGSPEQRQVIFDELKDIIVKMASTKYARHLVRKLLKYGNKQQRNFILKKFHGVIRKLIRNREAAVIIEYAYNEYANATQRLAILEEFYGPSFMLFKTNDTKSLDDFMVAQGDKRDMVLRNMKEALSPLIDKSLLTYSLVHRVFNEYFTYADNRAKSEMIEALRDTVVTMIHTRDGARVAMQCIWHGTAKDRKVIMKSFSGLVQKICLEEYSHMVLLAIFDCVDDTKIVKKCILEEMFKSVADIAQDTYGRKVLLYLLNPRDPLHFHPDVIKVLQDGDGNINSKKDSVVRHSELLEAVSHKLFQYIIEHSEELTTNNASLLLVLSILTYCHGDPTDAMRSIAQMAARPFTLGGSHIIESMAGHITFKRLIGNDRERMMAGKRVLFSRVLLDTLPEGAIKSWAACNRGCFTIISLLDLENTDITSRVSDLLAPIKASLKKVSLKGAQILAQKCFP